MIQKCLLWRIHKLINWGGGGILLTPGEGGVVIIVVSRSLKLVVVFIPEFLLNLSKGSPYRKV